MSKILAVADIHIHDYPNRNPSNRFRLYQGSRTVAQNIINVAKREGCEYIVLAGDIVEKSVVRPYIQSEVKLFLDTIMSYFKEGWIIWGNHDLDSKAIEQNIGDAVLGVMLPSNLHYAHKTMISREGTTFGFCNWMPKFDLSWIPNKVDVLFTHATISYSSDSGIYKSQELDESKFDLAFCGDIHRRAQLGKYISIGIPQRCKLSDSEEASGIVLDCSTKLWQWVDLNPDDNLMKFEITEDLNKEGWDETNHTWYVYKNDMSSLDPNDPNIKIDTWTEIEQLINEAILKTGLQEVHTEVLKNITNIDEKEVDFNFDLHRLHCENWRSITEATIDFNRGDKIFLNGSNGSGKSSLLSALKYAFLDCNSTQGLLSLKPFIQYGKDYCLTEVEFGYQGNEYKLRRGTKEWGLWINGEPQKYNNKKAFEEDVRDRFKFIEYLNDALLFDSEHHRFISGVSPERRIEIVSKFLKLDRIDTLNEVSKVMLDNLKKERGLWVSKINETEKILTYIQDKLNLISLPELGKSELEKLRDEGLEMQRKNNLWNQYLTTSANIQAKIQTYTSTLDDLRNKQATFRDPNVIDFEISSINQEIQKLNARTTELNNIRVNLEYKNREYEALRTEGNNAYLEAQSIGIGKICSHCGQPIKTTESLENHKRELMSKVESLKPKIEKLKGEIDSLKYQVDNSSNELQQINNNIQGFNAEVYKRFSEKTLIDNTIKEIQRYESLLSQEQAALSSLGVVEKVELPSDFMEKMSMISSGINSWIQYESDKNDFDIKSSELYKFTEELNKIDSHLSALEAYNKLTGPLGSIYEAIMNKLVKIYSDNNVEYIVTRSGKGNREHLNLTPVFVKSQKEKSEYSSASSGEKTYLDIHLLDKLITSSGILVLDETLKNLDPERLELVLDIIKNMNVGVLILTSHSEGLSNFYNKTISLSINDQGLTEIN